MVNRYFDEFPFSQTLFGKTVVRSNCIRPNHFRSNVAEPRNQFYRNCSLILLRKLVLRAKSKLIYH
jgi:hypothetical protein